MAEVLLVASVALVAMLWCGDRSAKCQGFFIFHAQSVHTDGFKK
jgi:hypothetical protein